MLKQKDKVLAILNSMFSMCEPMHYSEFNKFLPETEVGGLVRLEAAEPKVGITKIETNEKWGITTLSVIATITDLLCDARLCFNIDKEGFIVSVGWFNPETDNNSDGNQN